MGLPAGKIEHGRELCDQAGDVASQASPDGSVADSGECRSDNGPGPQTVEAVPGTGIAVEDDDSSRAALGARLTSLDSQSDYLAVCP
ncbi:MAG TPA: hypothetical protein VNH11_35555 [Pirellulales bacterium]|nr:hypothetical protein [Pirellulales bacterium]